MIWIKYIIHIYDIYKIHTFNDWQSLCFHHTLCSLLPLQPILANLVVKKMFICSSKEITGRITKTNKT